MTHAATRRRTQPIKGARDLHVDPVVMLGEIEDDHNTALVQEAEERARRKRIMRNYADHRPEFIRAAAGPMQVDTGEGTQEIHTHVTPAWILELTPEDLRELPKLPVAAFIEDPAWPWRLRPSFDNDHSWQMVFEGWACVRCASRHDEQGPERCASCGLSRVAHRGTLQLVVDRLKLADGFTPGVSADPSVPGVNAGVPVRVGG